MLLDVLQRTLQDLAFILASSSASSKHWYVELLPFPSQLKSGLIASLKLAWFTFLWLFILPSLILISFTIHWLIIGCVRVILHCLIGLCYPIKVILRYHVKISFLWAVRLQVVLFISGGWFEEISHHLGRFSGYQR